MTMEKLTESRKLDIVYPVAGKAIPITGETNTVEMEINWRNRMGGVMVSELSSNAGSSGYN
jgi:hypothetical protein